MRKNWGGPLIAAAAQGTTLSLNCLRNRNGKSANRNRNNRYQINGRLAFGASNQLKCHAHSSALKHASPIAGIQSKENSLVTPSSNTTSSKARPKTGEGLSNGRRSVAMISSRNGSTAASAGNCTLKCAGATKSL